MKVEIIRLEESEEHGTLGVMLLNGECFCCTLELPDRDNKANVSRIPNGEYIIEPHNSPHFGSVWIVLNVPNRSHILIHKGNTDDDTKGCILLGQYFGKLKGNRAVLNSGNTHNEFMRIMKEYDKAILVIREMK